MNRNRFPNTYPVFLILFVILFSEFTLQLKYPLLFNQSAIRILNEADNFRIGPIQSFDLQIPIAGVIFVYRYFSLAVLALMLFAIFRSTYTIVTIFTATACVIFHSLFLYFWWTVANLGLEEVPEMIGLYITVYAPVSITKANLNLFQIILLTAYWGVVYFRDARPARGIQI